MKILCLSARFPYPPLKGDQVILYNRLKRLSRRHEITLLTFWRGDADAEFLDAVRPHCREVVTVRHSLAGALLNLAKGVYTLLPFQVLLFRSGRFEREAARLIGSGGFDIVHAYMLRTAEYAKEARQPRVLDMIDAMHRNYERRGATERWFLREAFREEARRLKAYENSVADRFDASIFVSREDAETISSGRRLAIPLGVDTDQFNGNGGARTGGTILFSGNMSYRPNEEAALWFIENCLRRVRQAVPGARFAVVGNGPSRRLKSFHDGTSVVVAGRVPSMANALRTADLAVAPMQSGYGMHIKMLEAMSSSLPVVCTTGALGTIAATDGEHLAVRDDAEGFAGECVRLLRDRHAARGMGEAARKLVVAQYSWDSHTEKLESLYQQLALEPVRIQGG